MKVKSSKLKVQSFTSGYLLGLNKTNLSVANCKKGFSLLETMIVIGIFLTLIALTYPTIGRFKSTNSISSISTAFVAEFKNQQIQAMTGNTEDGNPQDYGIYIGDSSYTVFNGTSFDPNEASNFEVEIEDQFSLETTFPNNQIVFESKSGKILGFTPGQNTVTITEGTNGKQKTIHINKYGVIESVN